MGLKSLLIVPLSEMTEGQEADTFVLMTSKETLSTRDGRPYFRVAFRDNRREVKFPVWDDAPLAKACRDEWTPGEYYKVRGLYRETEFGPQLDIRKIRPVIEADRQDGFAEHLCRPGSRYDAQQMFDELIAVARGEIADAALRELVVRILEVHHSVLLTLPAATHNHHAFCAGWLEHVRSVTQNLLFLVNKYAADYTELSPPLSKDVAVAGAILHDIGKVRELRLAPQGAEYTAAGDLIGHVLQGRDIVREFAMGLEVDPETLLRLEHIIVSHQRLPEWGAPKPPMTPEALLVHYADDIDAKFQTFFAILRDEPGTGSTTSARNVLKQKVYRGGV